MPSLTLLGSLHGRTALVAVGQIKTPEHSACACSASRSLCGFQLARASSRRLLTSPGTQSLAAGTIVMHGAVVNAGAQWSAETASSTACRWSSTTPRLMITATSPLPPRSTAACGSRSGLSSAARRACGQGDSHRRALRDRNGAAGRSPTVADGTAAAEPGSVRREHTHHRRGRRES